MSKASFLANIYHCLQILSAFQVVTEYSPSPFATASSYILQEVLAAYTVIPAKRELEKLLLTRPSITIRAD